ncbi:MAG: hypothetical protein KDI51_06610 [Xanthomonadales bacterium]|nr:hypothetical protein [Xanthomonadales bacterium]
MLEKLGAVEWEKLERSFGPAVDVPEAIVGLASGVEARRVEALDFFWCKVIHQGTVCSSTPYSIPFILELMRSVPEPEKQDLLDLICAFASASTCPKYPDEGPSVIERCRIEVVRGWRIYLQIFASSTECTRCSAALALSHCKEWASEISAVLVERFEDEESPLVRASATLVVGKLAGGANASFLLRVSRSPGDALVKFCACLCILEWMVQDCPEDILAFVVGYLDYPLKIDEGYVQLPFSENESALGRVTALLSSLGEFEVYIPRIQGALTQIRVNDTASIHVAYTVLHRAFSSSGFCIERLTALQRSVIELFVASDALWYWGNTLLTLREFGLPEDKEGLQKILELAP